MYGISWFCLWNISRYISSDMLLASLLLPSGLKIIIAILAPRSFSLLFIVSELTITSLLVNSIAKQEYAALLFFFIFLPYLVAAPIKKVWKNIDTYWQRLLAITVFSAFYSVLCGFVLFSLTPNFGLTVNYALSGTISALTGGILLAPFLYLLYDYLQQKMWIPITPNLINHEITLRPSAIFWGLFYFSLGLLVQVTLSDQIKPLALLLMLLPNIFLAYKYGWQGGVMAGVINSILLTTARQITGSFESDQELQVFITSQTLVGLGLGIAISRQYLLSELLKNVNKDLALELVNKQKLAQQLVQVEENIRKSVARELHDEIGQNITAIQIQAMLLEKINQEEHTKDMAKTINTLALRIHTSTKQLLTQLRPLTLDELGLADAIRQISAEMHFTDRKVDFTLNFESGRYELDDITAVTLYRIVQELLNNVSKHSHADVVNLSLTSGDIFSLTLKDNGHGLPIDWKFNGQGLKGIQERVSALGGDIVIHTRKAQANLSYTSTNNKHIFNQPTYDGTMIKIDLPTTSFLRDGSHNKEQAP